MSLWHRIKVQLGLEDEWDDEYYDDEERDSDGSETYAPERDSSRGGPAYSSPYGSAAHPGAVRRVDRGYEDDRSRGGSLRSVPTGPASVTPVSPQVKMHIAQPKSFSEAQSIADKFKQGTPVILNLTTANPDLAKRLLDFSSGLTYGLDGGLQKVSDKTFMLTPHNVEVSDADRRRLEGSGMFPLPE